MSQALLYRLFGIGKLPGSSRSALESEGILFLEEGVGGSVTYRDFRGPGKYFSYRRVWFTGSVAVTRHRLVAFAFRRRLINVAHSEPARLQLRIEIEPPSSFLLAFEASHFHEGFAGQVEIRFHTDQAERLGDALGASVPTQGSPTRAPGAIA